MAPPVSTHLSSQRIFPLPRRYADTLHNVGYELSGDRFSLNRFVDWSAKAFRPYPELAQLQERLATAREEDLQSVAARRAAQGAQ